jgi:hypothetical protein
MKDIEFVLIIFLFTIIGTCTTVGSIDSKVNTMIKNQDQILLNQQYIIEAQSKYLRELRDLK